MQTYGQYELLDEVGSGTRSAVYQARDTTGQIPGLLALKVFRPFDPGATEFLSKNAPALAADIQLDFFKAAQLQQRAAQTGSGHFAPIHEAQNGPDCAWYVTDYYPRGSLARWISLAKRPRDLTAADLEHVVYATASGLLELKTTGARGHGRLTLSNVLLGGKPGTALRRTPIYLSDPQPGGPPEADQFELADLHALGEIIYQLVHRREAGHHYNYPINPSEEWQALGREGEKWRQLCNRLVNPRLTLKDFTLAALVAEIKPPEPLPAWLWKLGAGICLVLSLFCYLRFSSPRYQPGLLVKRAAALSGNPRSRESARRQLFARDVQKAQEATRAKKYPQALDNYRRELDRTEQLQQIHEQQALQAREQKRLQGLEQALANARQAAKQLDWNRARAYYKDARQISTNSELIDAELAQMEQAIKAIQQAEEKERTRRKDFEQALTEARNATNRLDWGIALTWYDKARRLTKDPASLDPEIAAAQATWDGLRNQRKFAGIPFRWITNLPCAPPWTSGGDWFDDGTHGGWVGVHEITQGEFQQVMHYTPSFFNIEWFRTNGLGQSWTSRLPVENVTWSEATNFCFRLTEQERLQGTLSNGWHFSLPTERQWNHYATDPNETAEQSAAKEGDSAPLHPLPVGTKKPNRFYLYDVNGNLGEWMADPYEYNRDTQKHRILGGTYLEPFSRKASPANLRYPASSGTNDRSKAWGFRIVLVPSPESLAPAVIETEALAK